MSLTTGAARSSASESVESVSTRDPGTRVPVAEALFDAIQVSEVSVDIVTPKQYAAWIRGPVNSLIPHRSFRIWTQSIAGGPWKAEACEPGEHDLLPTRELSAPQQHFISQINGLWSSGGQAPCVLEHTSPLLRPIIFPAHGAALIHGVSNLFGNRSIFMFIDDDPGTLRSGAAHVELLAFYLQLAAQRIRMSRASDRPTSGADAGPDLRSKLTARELRILECVREGKSNHEIGLVLHISEFTVKSHLQRIFRKLGVANRAQAVATAFSLRPVRPVQ